MRLIARVVLLVALAGLPSSAAAQGIAESLHELRQRVLPLVAPTRQGLVVSVSF